MVSCKYNRNRAVVCGVSAFLPLHARKQLFQSSVQSAQLSVELCSAMITWYDVSFEWMAVWFFSAPVKCCWSYYNFLSQAIFYSLIILIWVDFGADLLLKNSCLSFVTFCDFIWTRTSLQSFPMQKLIVRYAQPNSQNNPEIFLSSHQ